MQGPSWSRVEAIPPQTIEENWLFRLRRERFRSRHSGEEHDFYVMHLADAVNVVALTPDDRLVLVEQFRAGSARDSLETPGGLLDPGEDPLEAGARELLEETGYAGDPPVLISSVWSNPSILSSRITTILVRNARFVADPALDEHEEVRVEKVPTRQLPQLLANGTISHALAVQGLMAWMISEIPGWPLSGPEAGRLRRGQFRLSQLIALVVFSALLFGVVANLGFRPTIGLTIALSLPLSYGVVHSLLDPPRRYLLLNNEAMQTRRRLLRFFAVFGMALVVVLTCLLLLTGVRGMFG